MRVAGPDGAPGTTSSLEELHAPADALSVSQQHAQADVLAHATSAAAAPPAAGGSVLPAVLGDTPVAVLLINRVDGLVTFANRAAIALAGDIGLPVAIDAWGAAAGLTDLSGQALAGTHAPLSRVADGNPVAGEPVRLQPARSDDAERADASISGDEQLLWVTGFPLRADATGTPALQPTTEHLLDPRTDGRGDHPSTGDDHRDLSLVVFLPVTEGQATAGRNGSDPGDPLRRLQEQAIVATDVCFTITDPRRPDNPLIWVNPAFTRVTGYPAAEALGRNCRFLQGPGTDPAAVTAIREAIHDARQETVTLLNYRADGSAFWNQLTLTPVLDGSGEVVNFVGVQSDVSARISVERQREAALLEAQRGREVAETARRRLQLMSEASATLTGTLDVAELMDRLAHLCVPALADCIFIARLGADNAIASAVVRHRDGREDDLADLTAGVTRRPLAPRSPAADALRTGAAIVVTDVTSAAARQRYPDSDVHRLPDQPATGSLVALPLRARGDILGIMVLTDDRAGAFTADAVDLLTDLAARAGLALDNARLYQGQRSVAETLQRALLAHLPDIPGVQAAAHYASASATAAIGGDFYDLMTLPDDSIGISIGDVAGHDIDAAATMGQLRGLLRASAYDATRPDPADVLARVDELMHALAVPGLATLAHVHAHRPTADDDRWRLVIANAGHPPLALRAPDGTVQLLDGIHGLILGVRPDIARASTTVWAPRGSVLIAYTDGLIERSDQDLDQGLAQLTTCLTAQPVTATVEHLCTAVMAMAERPSDDVAVIAVQLW